MDMTVLTLACLLAGGLGNMLAPWLIYWIDREHHLALLEAGAPPGDSPAGPKMGARSIKWPWLELCAAACGGAWAYLHPAPSASTLVLLTVAVFVCSALVASDVASKLLPDALTVGGLWVALLAAAAGFSISSDSAILGAGLGYGLGAAISLVGHRLSGRPALGGGDGKLLALIGAVMGPIAVVPTLVMGSCLGLIAPAGQYLTGRRSFGTMAFGPYLVAAAAIWSLLGEAGQAALFAWLGIRV